MPHGQPGRLSTDVGPVIDAEAKTGIERHIQAMRAKGRKVYQAAKGSAQDEKSGRAAPSSSRR